jgi:hypothetical protein
MQQRWADALSEVRVRAEKEDAPAAKEDEEEDEGANEGQDRNGQTVDKVKPIGASYGQEQVR